MDRLLNAMKLHAGGMDLHSAETRLGIVTSYDPTNAAARVMIQPENTLSGWLPVAAVAVGAVSIVVPPSIGDQVVLEPQEGDAEQWIITGRLFSTAALPPSSPFTSAPIQSGEMAIFGQGGACLHLLANGTWALMGNLAVTGSITATGNVTAGLGTGDQVDMLGHAHTAPNGGGRTSAPIPGT